MKQTLQSYSNFTSPAELEAAVRSHLTRHRRRLTLSDIAVLELIKDDSLQNGAAHLAHTAMAEATGKSLSTVRRAIRKLEKLEMIERVHYIQPVLGGLGANIYVVLGLQLGKTDN